MDSRSGGYFWNVDVLELSRGSASLPTPALIESRVCFKILLGFNLDK